MAYFRCTTGGSGKGNTLVVTCADDLAGATITCTNGTKTYRKTCPSTAPYEVTFYGLEAGTWTLSATVSGDTYTTTVVVAEIEALLGGFNWKAWVDLSENYTSSEFTDLDDLLSDETAIRELMTIHACVDYLAGIAATSADVEKIIENDYCAKWINNRDYALDTLYANEIIAGYMDTADKYFYGEWVITDDTTTPPTWGPKGNVPVMTANNAPYGTASATSTQSGYDAYKAFDKDYTNAFIGNASTNILLSYTFTNPICPKMAKFTPRPVGTMTNYFKDYEIRGSNDGFSTYDVLATGTNPQQGNEITEVLTTDKYYMALGLFVKNTYGGNVGVYELQFYGRELSVSVPTMTGNTTPYGEVGASGDSSNAYRVFDGIDTVSGSWSSDNNATNNRLYYKFTSPTCVKRLEIHYIYAQSLGDLSFKVQVSDDGSNWSDIPSSDFTISFVDTALKKISLNVENNEYHLYWAIFTPNKIFVSGSGQIYITTLQFYGLDYSEKEFEAGTTKKWLYDHGVELVDWYLGSVGEKGNYYLKYRKGTDTSTATKVISAESSIDLSPYSLFRAKQGANGYNSTSNHNGEITLCVETTKGQFENSNPFRDNTSNDAPNNLYLDIAAVNSSYYPSFGWGVNSVLDFDLVELWLE